MILEEFGPDIRHITGEDNIVADVISRLPTAENDQNENHTESQGLVSKILPKMEHSVLEDDEIFPLYLSLVHRMQQKEINKRNSKFKQLLNKIDSKYNITTTI